MTSDRLPNLADGIDFRYQACPFPNSPSRFPDGKPHEKPVSGLERSRLAENYTTMMSIVHLVRTKYAESNGIDSLNPLSSEQLREVLRALIYLPLYLSLRGSKPFPAHGVLHPAFIVLSNSASGSLGALEAYIQKKGEEATLNSSPNAKEMIDAVEELGSKPLIGKKTICAASPEQMYHFLSSIINGVTMSKAKYDVSSFLGESEIPSLIEFGQYSYYSHDLMNAFKKADEMSSNEIRRHIKNRHNPRQIGKTVKNFIAIAHELLGILSYNEQQINKTLGRQTAIRHISLEEFKVHGFEMPEILKEMGISNPGAIAVAF